MGHNTSVRWNTKTAERAKHMAAADDRTVSNLTEYLINQEWQRRNPEPPIEGTCPTCHAETAFTFLAYWSQGDLYRCDDCRTVLTRSTIEQAQMMPFEPIIAQIEVS